MPHWKLLISGRVQGVWYRKTTREKAQSLGVTGFVRNEPNGNVYLEAEGSADHLEALKNWCHIGPEQARVDQVEVEVGEEVGFTGFEIRR